MFDLSVDDIYCSYIFIDGPYYLYKENWPKKFLFRPMIGETVISENGIRSKIVDIRHMASKDRILIEIVLGQPST